MVPDDVFQAWLALLKLVPLIWQPVIENIDEYTVRNSSSTLWFIF